jgi:hypothetical protein
VSEHQDKAKAVDEAKERVKQLEQDPPEKLEDWPDDEAKYETFGGPEGEHSYDEGPERKMGPASLRHHPDGSVSVAGEEVDDPDEYKGPPIPGGPTDTGEDDSEGEESGDEESSEEDGSEGSEEDGQPEAEEDHDSSEDDESDEDSGEPEASGEDEGESSEGEREEARSES